MAKKTWKIWSLTLNKTCFERGEKGSLRITFDGQQREFSPKETRRLFQKLSGDYRD